MGINTNIIEIYADYIYYIIIGEKKMVNNIMTILANEKVDNYVEYISVKANVPLAIHKENIEKLKNIVITLDPIVEEAHAKAYSLCDMKTAYMMLYLKKIDNKYILTFPRYIMVDGDDPEKGIINEFSRLSNNKITHLLENTISLHDIIGIKKDTLLYMSILKSQNNQNNNRINELLKILESLTDNDNNE